MPEHRSKRNWWPWALLALPILAVVAMFSGRILAARTKVNVVDGSTAPFIPKAASHIYATGSMVAFKFEFNISEDDFESWANEGSMKMSSGSEPRSVHSVALGADVEVKDWRAADNLQPRGSGYTVVYDRATGKAYGSWASH